MKFFDLLDDFKRGSMLKESISNTKYVYDVESKYIKVIWTNGNYKVFNECEPIFSTHDITNGEWSIEDSNTLSKVILTFPGCGLSFVEDFTSLKVKRLEYSKNLNKEIAEGSNKYSFIVIPISKQSIFYLETHKIKFNIIYPFYYDLGSPIVNTVNKDTYELIEDCKSIVRQGDYGKIIEIPKDKYLSDILAYQRHLLV